jgi:hypothetical protein
VAALVIFARVIDVLAEELPKRVALCAARG